MLQAIQLRNDNVDAVVIIAHLLGFDYRHIPHEFPYYTDTKYLVVEGDMSDYSSCTLSIYNDIDFVAQFKFITAQNPYEFAEIVTR